MKEKKYWTVDPKTSEVSLIEQFAQCRGGIAHVPANSLTTEPLPAKQGFAVVAFDDLKGSQYIEDHRGKTIYNKSDCTKLKNIFELGPIEKDWTLKVPLSQFDEWVYGQWVTNNKKRYENNYKQIDANRRTKYTKRVRPYLEEAQIKKYQGLEDDYQALLDKAAAERVIIQEEEPWPEMPEDIL